MAKKPRSGRPQPGGRVTPKGAQPARNHRRDSTPPASRPEQGTGRDHSMHGRLHAAPHVPTRAGHHRGQR